MRIKPRNLKTLKYLFSGFFKHDFMQYRPILSKAGNYTHKATEIMLSLLQKRERKTQNPMIETSSHWK